MKSVIYDIDYKNNNCILRSISKAINISPSVVENDLKNISSNYADEKVFDKYLLGKGFIINNEYNGKLIQDINLNGINIIFAFKDEWYHMFTVINNVIYDKYGFESLSNMKIIKIYKLK